MEEKTINKEQFWMPAQKQDKNALFTPEKKEMIIKMFRKTGHLSNSCKAIGIDRMTFYYHLNKDQYLKKVYLDALEDIADDLESVAIRSAKVEGAQGFKDRQMWLKAHREKFKDKVEHEHIMNDKQLLQAYYSQLPKDTKKLISSKVVEVEEKAS